MTCSGGMQNTPVNCYDDNLIDEYFPIFFAAIKNS